MEHVLTVYQALEAKVKKGDLDALLARWAFGKKLLEERGDDGRFPPDRVATLSNALEASATELYNRAQFAEEYDTKAKVEAAFKEHGSWFMICKLGLGYRGGHRFPEGPPSEAAAAYVWLAQRADRFLEPGRDEAEHLAVIVADRAELHPYEIENLCEVFVGLFHRVNAALSSLRQRRLITPTVEPVLSDEQLHGLFAHDGPTLLDFAGEEARTS